MDPVRSVGGPRRLVRLEEPAPTDVMGLTSGVACVAAGEEHACALTTAGAVKCWGNDSLTGIGWGPNPVDIPGLSSGVVQIASGELDTCALLTDGSVKCWGRAASSKAHRCRTS